MKKEKPLKRFTQYQVDNDKRYGGVKTVAEITEKEAKTELCDAFDLIEKLEWRLRQMTEDIKKYLGL